MREPKCQMTFFLIAFVLEPMDPISSATMYRIARAKNQSSLAMTTLSFTIRQSLQ